MENRKMNPIYELESNEYNLKLSNILKDMPEFEQPEWSFFTKTGVAKVRPPQEKDFWHKRAASILRQIYINRVVGVNRLKTRYGSRKNRGVKPEKFKKGSGKIIRVILQQSEKAGLLEKFNVSGKRAGRKLTDKGKELLESVK
jgi:small subunit ribosomal protein S19e